MRSLSEIYNVHIHGPKKSLEDLTRNNNLNFKIHEIPTNPYSLVTSLLPLGRNLTVKNLWVPHYNVPWRGVENLFVTVHDVLHARTDIIPRKFVQSLYAKLTFSKIQKVSKAVIFVSTFSKTEFESIFGKPNSAYVIHNGIATTWAKLKFNRPPIINLPPYLFYIGNALRHKNLAFLIDAYLEIASVCPYDLVIAGKMDGFLTQDMHPILRREESCDRIHMLGGISQPHLESLMYYAKALVFPSLYEGFGFPPLEAMAAGTPVMVSDIPVHREVLGDSVEYFNPYQKSSIQASLMKALPRPEVDFSELYSWATAANQTKGVFAKYLPQNSY